MRSSAARRVWSRVALVAGCLLVLLGAAAGIVNREVLDGARFAEHVDNVRTDPAVARQVGLAITRQVLQADPDLIAYRPLVESLATSLAGSTALSPAVRQATERLHAAVVDPQDDPVVLRLADVGALLVASLQQVAPDADVSLPPDLDVTLAEFGSGSWAESAARQTDTVRTLAWLLPLLGLLLLGVSVLLEPDRWPAGRRAGAGLALAGALLGGVALAGDVWARRADTGSLRPAVAVASWHELSGPLWRTAFVLVLAGTVIALVSLSRRASVSETAQTWRAAATRTDPPALVARAGACTVAGLALLLEPVPVLRLTLGLTGLALLLLAVEALLRLRTATGGLHVRWRLGAAVLALPSLLLLGLLAWQAAPADEQVPAAAASARGGGACNGHRELCSRPYDEVAFPATHNSMSAGDQPGWFLAEQPDSIIRQLDAGVRVLLVDTWYGQQSQRGSTVVTAERNRPEAQKQAEQDYDPAVVEAALRLRRSANLVPAGPVRPYLCHAMCELGATPFDGVLDELRGWLDAHPREVVTLFIQDEVTPADTAAAFDQAGLLDAVHTQEPGAPWPTLGEMVRSGKRLVVLMENAGGGSAHPWLLQGFDWVQDTPYTNPTTDSFSCDRLRGRPDSPLLLINHWLSGVTSIVTDAERANARDVLLPHVQRCRDERGHLPNYVAVNWYSAGDLFGVVDELNGL